MRNFQFNQGSHRGFTLLEIAIALVLIGLLMVGGVKLFGTTYHLEKGKQAKAQLHEIKNVLLTYVKVNGYLPCPDKMKGRHSGDGYEDRKLTGACSTREGYLPTQTLGIDDKDPWHQPFYYRVNARAEDLNRVTDICQSASVFGAITSTFGVPRTKDSDFAQCPDNKMYYCRGCNDVCSQSCNSNVDPRPNFDKPPYFHTSTPPIGAEDDGFKNLTIQDEAGNTLDEVQVAVVASFGSNGLETWSASNHCPDTLTSNEQENCDNDAIFVSSNLMSFDDFLIGISLREVKRVMIETGLQNY